MDWNRTKLAAYLRAHRRIDEDGCWIFTGHIQISTRTGKPTYGVMRIGDHMYYVHKVSAWVFLKNPKAISSSRKVNVCHTCDKPACFRPKHLVVKTPKWNTRDAVAKGIHACARKSECKYGHPLAGNNLVVTSKQRVCRNCRNRRARDSYREAHGIVVRG